jgi:molybdopterin-guanine dinucleotide biosynthesis protein A
MDESILRECDKNLASFFNVNTPELIDTARDMME